MFVLLVDREDEYGPPDVHGPFDSVEEATKYAEEYRRNQGLPVGWYFGIVEPRIVEAKLMRTPLFLLTDDEYRPLGTIANERGRFVGRDTRGKELFSRKDWKGMQQASKRFPRLVTTVWYGIQ